MLSEAKHSGMGRELGGKREEKKRIHDARYSTACNATFSQRKRKQQKSYVHCTYFSKQDKIGGANMEWGRWDTGVWTDKLMP
jgi:hypothetical protein